MNAPPTLVDAWDPRVLAEADLRHRCPDALVWFGHATRRWWAAVESAPGRWHLVEADRPEDLRRLIDATRATLSRSAPVPPQGARPRHARRR